jgi:hypothetical protein
VVDGSVAFVTFDMPTGLSVLFISLQIMFISCKQIFWFRLIGLHLMFRFYFY